MRQLANSGGSGTPRAPPTRRPERATHTQALAAFPLNGPRESARWPPEGRRQAGAPPRAGHVSARGGGAGREPRPHDRGQPSAATDADRQ